MRSPLPALTATTSALNPLISRDTWWKTCTICKGRHLKKEYDKSKILCFLKVFFILDTILRLSSCESIPLFCEIDIYQNKLSMVTISHSFLTPCCAKLGKSDGKLWYGLVSFLFEETNIFFYGNSTWCAQPGLDNQLVSFVIPKGIGSPTLILRFL